MEEELVKQLTDCVYFLASPLTCKKGLECEYRHSDIARLNPRECWYWLAGSCHNPSCAFRHPPLDGHMEASSQSSLPQYDSTIPVNKTNVPCFFYFNGFCNKGERCSFMHGPDEGTLTLKPAQPVSTVDGEAVEEKKMVTKSETGSAPIETQINTSEAAAKGSTETRSKTKQDFHRLPSSNVAEKSVSPHMSESDCEEVALVRSESLPPPEGFVESRSPVSTDQSSEEEQVDCHLEREEWLESSPGFDVLVDDGLEGLAYENDYVALDMERGELNGQFLENEYDYQNQVEYDPENPDAAIFHEQELNDSYDYLDNEHNSDYTRKTPEQSRVLGRISPRKRKFSRMEPSYNGRNRMDLRDHLQKRRLVDGHTVDHFSRRHYSSRLIVQSWERPRMQAAEWYHGRLASHVGKNIHRSRNDGEIPLSNVNQQGRLRRSRINRSRRQYKEKRRSKHQFLSSEVTMKSASKSRSAGESSMFTAPKSLDQIREEKKKAHKKEDSFQAVRNSSRTSSEDFQGPKPLSEILEDKRRLISVKNQVC